MWLTGEPQTGVRIRNKPKTRDDRLLQDRPDLNRRWSDCPWTLLVDGDRLERLDVWVYCCLASRNFKSDLVSVSWDWVSKVVKCSRASVKRSIHRLVEAGHLEVLEPAKGSRPALFRITSSVFAKRQRVILSTGRRNVETTRAEIDRKQELGRKLRRA